jgi:branched-chain amino acid transport system permease protein
MTQGALLILGSGARRRDAVRQRAFGGASFSIYRLVLVAVAVAGAGRALLLFMKTRFGRHAGRPCRTPRWPAPAFPSTEFSVTFGLGAALAGLAGGSSADHDAQPMMGASFVIEAFVTVVAGGANILIGTPPAAVALAVIKGTATAFYGQVYGVMSLLVAVLSRGPSDAGRLHGMADPPPFVRRPG